MDIKEKFGIRTWVEVGKKALKQNYDSIRRILEPNCKLMAVVKSNAYGHGLIDYTKTMDSFGVDWFGVDSIVEALKLRQEGVKKPILVLGYTLPDRFKDAIENNISITISNMDQIEDLRRFFATTQDDTKNLKIHLKFDTGMHRQGFFAVESNEITNRLKKIQDIEIEGVYTHFASAKNPAFPTDTKNQLAEFEIIRNLFIDAGLKPIFHSAASGSTMIFKESHFDMVRVGIALLGQWPSAETRVAYQKDIKLIPALKWKTIVSEIKEIKNGERIGYGLTEILRRDTKIAILPVGYWHGYKWSLSSVGNIIAKGQRAKVLGRVSMDMVTIDVTDIKGAKVGDEVVLLGRDGANEITAEEFALMSNSYNYEVITTINPLIKRIYI
jgi:alanine racemase